AKDLLRISPELGCDLVLAMQKVGRAVMEATGADGFNVIQNNGRAAGQEVEHVHWHVIPRFDGDGLAVWAQTKYESMEAMNAMAEQIRAKIV
ncbi:MAG: HIT family protein, partial [Mailhella sp.]|nr:HIT family protein [Mailhella sp.]